MTYNITSETETLNKKSNKEEGAVLFNNPAYRERFMACLAEAQRKAMDFVQFYDGTIVLIENKIAMYYYEWDKKKREFQRKKQQTVLKSDGSS
ncbi:MAG: hypothetical protein PG981_001160 [Wolbachia endosymbiont of Ctenocephalides orientis wCori]|nr:MAG: hypothetical protein PG981_001160 [Wolbachia endosymbiont of Ctenocephalides orientis wCori]